MCFLLPAQYMRWTSAYSVVPCCVAALGIVLTVAVLIIYIKYDNTPIVKASGRELVPVPDPGFYSVWDCPQSYILLVGMFLCYCMTFALLAKPTAFVCGVKRVGVGFGFAMLYASMLVKTNRIYRIFHYGRRNIRPSCIAPWTQVALVAALTSVQLIGSLIWLLITPPSAALDHSQRGVTVLRCNLADHWFLVSLAYDANMIVACTAYAIRARHVPENYNEAKFIGFTMYTTCVIWLAFVPIYFGTGNNFEVQTTTLCISISLSAMVALFCIFAPKLWIIIMEPEKNVVGKPGDRRRSEKPEMSYQATTPTYNRESSMRGALEPSTGALDMTPMATPKCPLLMNSTPSTSNRAGYYGDGKANAYDDAQCIRQRMASVPNSHHGQHATAGSRASGGGDELLSRAIMGDQLLQLRSRCHDHIDCDDDHDEDFRCEADAQADIWLHSTADIPGRSSPSDRNVVRLQNTVMVNTGPVVLH